MDHAIDRLYAAVLAARSRDPAVSRTAKLLREGLPKMAKKVVEESADLVYNLAVLWAHSGVAPDDVWAEMDRRERAYGIAEKLPKQASR